MASSKILIVQHEIDTPPGTVLRWARERGLETQTWFPAEVAAPPALKDFQAVIFCGGSMDTHQEAEFPWLKTEKEFLKSAMDARMKIFGICLGSQLMCEALGGRVKRMDQWEIGWWPVREEKDPTKSVLGFHWHRYECELPKDMDVELTNDHCRVQGFRRGRDWQAVQFHPEADENWVELALKDSEESLPRLKGFVQTAQEMREGLKHQDSARQWFFRKLDSWFSRD